MTKTRINLPRRGRLERALAQAPAAFVLSLVLAACQGAPPPDARSGAQGAVGLMKVADETRAGGDLGTAVSLYRRAAELSPQDPLPLGQLGATLAQLHAYTEAATAYRAALAISPNPIEGDLHRGLAVVLLSLNQPQAALNELALVHGAEDPRYYNTMGVAHDLLGRHDLAQQDYAAGLKLAPFSVGLRNNLGLSQALAGNYAAAEATLDDLAKAPDASARHRLNLALVYGLAGDDAKAAAIARPVLDEAAIKNNLAYYALLRGLDDRARANAIMMGQPPGPMVAEAGKSAGKTATAQDDQPPAAEPRAPVAVASLPPAKPHSMKPAEATATVEPKPAPAAAPAAAPSRAAPAPAAAETAPAAGAPMPLAKAEEQPTPAPAPDAPPQAPAEPARDAAPDAAQPEATAPPPPAADRAAGAEPAQPPSAAPKGVRATGFVVQLGSFASEANAQKLVEQLNRKGYEVALVHNRDREGRDWYVVRAGGYANAEEAAAAARHLREAERVPAVVVHLRQPNQA